MTKESSVMDFTYLSISELEDQVRSLFPNRDSEDYLHYCILGALPFRMICNGWTKEELLTEFLELLLEAEASIEEFQRDAEITQ